MAMDESGAELVLKWFQDLERRFVTVCDLVPIGGATNEVFLPALSSIILEACSLVDTVLRSGLPTKAKRDDARCEDYARQYEPKFGLGAKRSIIFSYPLETVIPFRNWYESNTFAAPPWWKAHNKLKHDRIKHFDRSTMRNAIDSLAALHQTMAIEPAFLEPLIRHDMLSFRDYAMAYAIETFRGEHDEPGLFGLIESTIFATLVGKQSFPEDPRDANISLIGMGKKLGRHITRQF